MELKDLLSQYFERSNAMNSLWGYYITVVLALLAYLGNPGRTSPIKHWAAVALTVAFGAFAWNNASALLEVVNARNALKDRLLNLSPAAMAPLTHADIVAMIQPPSHMGTIVRHASSDIAFIFVLWFVVVRRL